MMDRSLTLRQLDRRFAELREHAQLLHAPRGGWVRLLRTVLGMRQGDLGARLNVSAQAVAALEKREAEDNVTLASLRAAADALDAELYYVVLPRQRLQARLEAEIERVARFMATQVHHSMRMEDQATETAELQQRIEEIKDQLRRTPSLLWTLPNDG